MEVRYLGFHLGDRQVCPQIDKTAAKVAYPGPQEQKGGETVRGAGGIL